MQQKPTRRPNAVRSQVTRKTLIKAARKLFVEKGYGDTGTPEIVATAKVTRGALYHHFADKAELFRAVIEAEAQSVAVQIRQDAAGDGSALDVLMAGAGAYFEAMAEPGRARLLLIDGPSVLGHETMNKIDDLTGAAELRAGLSANLSGTVISDPLLNALTEVLSAAFDQAALAIAMGKPADPYKSAIRLIFKGLLK